MRNRNNSTSWTRLRFGERCFYSARKLSIPHAVESLTFGEGSWTMVEVIDFAGAFQRSSDDS